MATIPYGGCDGILDVIESNPFFDISDQILLDIQFGLMGMAFHPNFVQNGRFFLSYNCDKMKNPGCLGRCSSNTDVNCDPTELGSEGGVQPCQYHSVIAEFTVNHTEFDPLSVLNSKFLSFFGF